MNVVHGIIVSLKAKSRRFYEACKLAVANEDTV